MENRKLIDKLVEMDRLITINRTWGGMDWTYGPVPAFRTKKLAELLRSLLDEISREETPVAKIDVGLEKTEG